MQYIDADIPTKVYLSTDVMVDFKHNCTHFGRKCLIVTGKSGAAKSGALSDAIAVLKSESVEYEIFDQIEANPSVETIKLCEQLHFKSKVNFVLAIGGGSVMDAAKAICFALAGINFLVASTESPKPLMVIPTAAGTGSEITQYAILTFNELKTKASIKNLKFPDFAFCNPKYLASLDAKQVVSMYFDISCHAIESSLSVKRGPIQLGHAKTALNLLAQSRSLLNNDLSLANLFRLQLASIEAGVSISKAGTSIPHGMSYPITYNFKVPHGLACATYLADYLKFCPENNVKDLLNAFGYNSASELKAEIHKFSPKIELSDEQKNFFTEQFQQSGKMNAHGPLDIQEVRNMW
ncbi:Alcohol_dehydrogenase [Hexamita inflata]|uniref:Alcohol dehydrogenase n=1 Tax=Hexamita inflata TaxID=28002 RepID=A0AA86UVQ3_9EUKA|nr:Alcohol dehydrogenase [Hexamita inflata]